MVQTANFREGNDIAGRGRLYWTRTRALLAERKMRSGVMMVLKIARQNAAQMALVEDDDVIQTFATDRTDKTLSVRVLPRRSRRSDDLRDAELEQLPVNARRTPQRVGVAHAADQITDFWIDPGPSRTP